MRGERGGAGRLWRTACGLLALLLALTVAAGCQPGVKPTIRPLAEIGKGGANTPRLSFFLTLDNPDGPALQLRVSTFEILAGSEWLPVATGPLLLDSRQLGARQLFLGSRILPAGNYERVRFTVAGGAIRRADGSYAEVAVAPSSMELALPSSVPLGKEDSRLLLLTWNVQESLAVDGTLRPVLAIGPAVRQLPADLVYVACPDIDTIFVVRSDKNWVVDAFGLKGGPTYLYLSPDPNQQRLTVLAARDAVVKVVDLASQRIIDAFPIPLTNTPSFMTLSPDGLSAYVLDEKNHYLSRLDLLSGKLAARVRINYRPQHAAYLADSGLLAVSAALSQAVSLRDPLTLAEVGSLRTNSSPDGLFASRDRLFIAESGANTVAVFELAANRLQSRLTVGFTPRRLLDNGDQVYVSNYDEGSISVVLPGQLSVGRMIYGLERPLEMAFSETYRRLYVGDDQAAGLAIIDTATDRFNGYLYLGARPLGLAAVQ